MVIAAYAAFEDSVRAMGLGYSAVVGDPRQLVDNLFASRPATSVRRTTFAQRAVRYANRDMNRRMRDGLVACQDADLIIVSPVSIAWGYHVAESLRLPLVRAFLFPLTPTRDYPLFQLPAPISHHESINLWTYYLARQVVWLGLRRAINRARRDVLGLLPAGLSDPLLELDRRQSLLLYGYSPAVVPPPSDWGDWIHVTGNWLLGDATDWNPPADLVDFLAAGPPPIYIGFGSMLHPGIQQIADRLTDAVLGAGQRVILSRGAAGVGRRNTSADVKVIGDVPHGWLFPQMAAVVHHGGAGTTSRSLSSGKPTLIVRFVDDEGTWGRRVRELGVGVPLLLHRDVERAALSRVIDQLVNSSEMRERAEELGRRIRSEDGVGRAVELIQDYYAKWQREHFRNVYSIAVGSCDTAIGVSE